jgi:ferritin-like metal-binding protein YciE
MSTVAVRARNQDHVSTNGVARRPVNDHKAAASVGWSSIALGAAKIVAPSKIARLVGLDLNPNVVQLLGAREVVSGLGIMTQKRPAGWLWGRVVGDIMDLAVLRLSPIRREPAASSKLAAATVAVVGVALLDAALGIRYTADSIRSSGRPRTPYEQLVHFLSDMYSVEQQALAQLVSATTIAGDPQLADDFRRHYTETEHQAGLVEQRLEEHGASPSAIKNAVMKVGGKGFLLFARAMPETPGRLLVHSYAYEAMEWAGYEMLIRFAELAGDHETIAAARMIRAQERTMMQRLEHGFDAAERMAHADLSPQNMRDHVSRHLAEVHAFESQGIALFKKGENIAGSPKLEDIYSSQLNETRKHARLVEERLQSQDSSTSKLMDSALAAGGLNWGLFFQAQSDTPAKFAAFVYAVLHLEIGGYEMLKRTAHRAGDRETEQLCEKILVDKRSMTNDLTEAFDAAVTATFNGKSDARLELRRTLPR